MMRKPIAWKRFTIGATEALSRSLTVTKIAPERGSAFSAASCALANARPNDSEMPITSPVERISGPRIGSNSRNFLNGKTASFTLKNGGTISSVKPISASVSPHMTRAATEASGTPIAFDTNGIVRLARGFTSSTYTSPSRIAYCTLIRPTTPSAFASATVCARITSWYSAGMRTGGSTQAESPE